MEYNRRRKVGIRCGLLYGMHSETGKPPKITFTLVDILLTEYETGTFTIRQKLQAAQPF